MSIAEGDQAGKRHTVVAEGGSLKSLTEPMKAIMGPNEIRLSKATIPFYFGKEEKLCEVVFITIAGVMHTLSPLQDVKEQHQALTAIAADLVAQHQLTEPIVLQPDAKYLRDYGHIMFHAPLTHIISPQGNVLTLSGDDSRADHVAHVLEFGQQKNSLPSVIPVYSTGFAGKVRGEYKIHASEA